MNATNAKYMDVTEMTLLYDEYWNSKAVSDDITLVYLTSDAVN